MTRPSDDLTGPLVAAGLRRGDADEIVTSLHEAYPDAGEADLAGMVDATAALFAGGGDYYTLTALIEDHEAHLLGPLLDAGHTPLDVAQASELFTLEQLTDAAKLGAAPKTLVTAYADTSLEVSFDAILELLTDGMPAQLLEAVPVPVITGLRDTGLTYDDIAWLNTRGVLDNQYRWGDLPELTGIRDDDPEQRRLTALLVLATGDAVSEMRAVAAAMHGESWTDTAITLLTDSDEARSRLAATISTARALAGDLAVQDAAPARWQDPPQGLAEPRTPATAINTSRDLTAEQAATRSRLRRAGRDAPFEQVKFWLNAGMAVEDAIDAAMWAGVHSYTWLASVEDHTRANPMPTLVSASTWLTEALARGNTLDDVRVLASAFHQSGIVGPYVAARVLGLGTPLQTALAWARAGYDVDLTAILTAYGIDEDVIGRIVTKRQPQASRIVALGVPSSQLEDALAVVTHWPDPRVDLDTPDPISSSLIADLAAHQLTTSDLDDAAILDTLTSGELDPATVTAAVVLHARFGRYVGAGLPSGSPVALAAAVSGKAYAQHILDGAPRVNKDAVDWQAAERAWKSMTAHVRTVKRHSAAVAAEKTPRRVRVNTPSSEQNRSRSS